jgi:hypothetical protein
VELIVEIHCTASEAISQIAFRKKKRKDAGNLNKDFFLL